MPILRHEWPEHIRGLIETVGVIELYPYQKDLMQQLLRQQQAFGCNLVCVSFPREAGKTTFMKAYRKLLEERPPEPPVPQLQGPYQPLCLAWYQYPLCGGFLPRPSALTDLPT